MTFDAPSGRQPVVDPNWESTHPHYRCMGYGVPWSQENENLTYKRIQLRTIVRGRGVGGGKNVATSHRAVLLYQQVRLGVTVILIDDWLNPMPLG